MVVGRLAAGFGESQFVTGCVSWSIASVGPQRAGMSMSWTGIAMFAALAIGAPIGMALYQRYGLEAAMIACIVAPLVAGGHRLPGSLLRDVRPANVCRSIGWSGRSGAKASG